jgi:glycopeptide antibiotics resistance protein
MTRASNWPYIFSLIIGAFYAVVVSLFWGVYAVVNPLNDWLIEIFANQGRDTAYYFAIYSHDVIANILLALPFAFLISIIPPRRSWKLLGVALLTSLILLYWRIIFDFGSLFLLSKHWAFWTGLAMAIASPSLAFAAVVKFQQRAAAT